MPESRGPELEGEAQGDPERQKKQGQSWKGANLDLELEKDESGGLETAGTEAGLDVI